MIYSYYQIHTYYKYNQGPSWSYGSWIYNYLCNQCLSPLKLLESILWQGVLDTTLCDKVCQWLAADRWFSPGTAVSSNNKTDRHEITEILMKVAALSFLSIVVCIVGGLLVDCLYCWWIFAKWGFVNLLSVRIYTHEGWVILLMCFILLRITKLIRTVFC